MNFLYAIGCLFTYSASITVRYIWYLMLIVSRYGLKDDDWVDEPDVCMFCDDGVVDGDYLIWYV